MRTTTLNSHLLIIMLLLPIFVSSFFLPCLSNYPILSQYENNDTHQHHPTHNALIINKASKDDPQDDKQESYYYGFGGLRNLIGSNKVVEHSISRNHHNRALAPSSSVSPPRKRNSNSNRNRIVNVDAFLRKNRKGDHTKAFRKAWKLACSSKAGVFLVPRHTYTVRPIKFDGPCKSPLVMKILGTIQASLNVTHYKDRSHWIVFENIRNFKVDGGGTINGHGKMWWDNSCKRNKSKPCQHAPTAVTFVGCKNLIVDKLRIINAQQMHLTFQKSANVRASNLMIRSPGNSPNTDGIHVTETKHIRIARSNIQTGDDCISIVSGSKNVQATDIICGPGHGISIGSLGKGHSKAHVSDVLVSRATLSGTTNGVRIKTWQGGEGYAKNIVFKDIVMRNVSNPIIIDQNYCDQAAPCQQTNSAVHIKNVVYKNIRGTSATDMAIKLECSKSHECKKVVLQNIHLVHVNKGQKQVKAHCQNVRLVHRGKVSPTCSQIH